MSSILTPIVASPLADGTYWVFDEPFSYQDDKQGLITIPKGFPTDWGSIPRPLQGLISPTGHGTWGYGIHDGLYASQPCQKADADDVLFRMNLADGINRLEDDLILDGLKIGGWEAWNWHTKNRSPEMCKNGDFSGLLMSYYMRDGYHGVSAG